MANINAVLVRLSISLFNNTRQDLDITREVKIKKGLGNGAGKWVKYKLPDEALTPLRELAGEIRRWHYTMSLPWEEGYALLPNNNRAAYDATLETYRQGFDELVTEFGNQWPTWVAQARIMHGPTFNPSDYPDWSKVRQTFKIMAEHSPVPNASHFDSSLRGLYGDALTELNEARIQAAVAETWERLLEPVRKMADALASPDTIFRDSLVENVRDMAKLVPALNLNGNHALANAAQAIKDALNVTPDALRENKIVRKETAAAAAALVARFGSMGQRKFAA